MLPMRRVSQPGAWFNRSPSSERTDLPGCRGRQISNPQPNPQFVVSCTSYGYFGSPRVLVSCCKPINATVTAEVASSSLVVPAILQIAHSNKFGFAAWEQQKSLPSSCLASESAPARSFWQIRHDCLLELAHVYTVVYIYLGGVSWPSLAYLSPGTARL